MDNRNKHSLFFVLLLSLSQVVISQEPVEPCVILLHGLARTDRSLNKMGNELAEEGYQVVNQGYASREHEIDYLAEDTLEKALEQCSSDAQISFVTHSLGGILVRFYLETNEIERLDRVVMLGPPNQGSQVVDEMRNVPGFELLNGPAGLQLGTDEESVPSTLGAVNFEVGVIAGTRTINPVLSTMLPNPDDGKVSVENTRVEGMADHISLPVSHALMMKNSEVIRQTIYFLKHGEFDHSDTEINLN